MNSNHKLIYLRAKVLKISVLATFIALSFQVVYSQDVNQSISMNVRNITLKQFLKQIEEKTKIAIVYRNILIDEKNDITLSVENKPVLEVMNNVLNKKGLQADIINKSIVIKKADEPRTGKKRVSVVKLSGLIVDDTNLPVIGATIKVSGTNSGTITDLNGKFEIDAPTDGVLEVSYVGYGSRQIAISGKKTLNITLNQDNKVLDEVVVVGYGTMKKSDMTGSVASLKSDDILKTKSSNFIESMQGKMAGVQISSQSGEPGSNIDVKIRGANSIYGGTSPLYVIDGIQVDVNTNEVASASVASATSMSPLSNINPSDIESIEVLKDASATAIFGSRGANGVIIVTTKSGKIGKNIFQYDGSYGLAQPTKRMNMLNGDEYIDYQRFLDPNSSYLWIDSNNDGKLDSNDTPRDLSSVKQFNWQDEMLRTAPMITHNFGFSGGMKNTTYSAGLGYLNQDGIIKNNDYQRYSGRVKVDYTENKISAGFNLNASYSMQNGASSAGGGTQYNGVVQFVTLTKPIDVSDVNADYMTGGKFVYPTTMIDLAQKNIDLLRVMANTYFNYQLSKELKLQIEIGGNISSSKSKEFYSKETAWGYINNGKAAIQENRSVSWFNREMLTFNKKFGKHNLNVMGGFEFNNYDFENFFIGVANFPIEATGVNDISKAKTVEKYISNKWGTNRVSYLGRLNYNFNDKYLVTASMRADGSDKFGSGNRYGYFPSAAFAWRANQENFLRDIEQLTNLKLRLSYGITGNERIPAYSYFARLDNSYYSYNGNLALGLAPAAIANPDLKWESTTQYNGGIDFGIFKNRISFSVDYFLKQTKDMLLLSPVSAQTGYSQQWKNIGGVDNYGIELMLTTHNIDTKNFKWITSINFSKSDNKVTDLGPGVNFIPVTIYGGFFQNVGRVVKGESIGTAYGFEWDGVYQLEDFTWQNDNDPSIDYKNRIFVLKPDVVRVAGSSVKPGSFKFKDLNNDNVVDDTYDRKIISRSIPKHYGGINNTFIYKNFELGVFFDWSYGNQILNEGKYLSEGTQSWMNLRSDFWHNRWTPENPTNLYGTVASQNSTSTFISSYYVEDASFIRLKTVNLIYNFPAKIASKLRFNDINVYVNGSNLYTFTKYSGYDPDISYYNQLLTGFDRYSYPKSRTITFGIKATF